MPLSSAIYDPQRYREEQLLYDELRASFDDPLPIHTIDAYHPFMVAGRVEENKAKQLAVLGRIEHEHSDVKERGLKLAQEFTTAQHDPNAPKPGQRPVPGQPIHTPPTAPGPNVPGTPGYDPSKPVTDAPQEPQPTHHEDNP